MTPPDSSHGHHPLEQVRTLASPSRWRLYWTVAGVAGGGTKGHGCPSLRWMELKQLGQQWVPEFGHSRMGRLPAPDPPGSPAVTVRATMKVHTSELRLWRLGSFLVDKGQIAIRYSTSVCRGPESVSFEGSVGTHIWTREG